MSKFQSDADTMNAKHRLTQFLPHVVETGLKSSQRERPFGQPCSRLIMDLIMVGVDAFAERLLTKFGEQGEYRLNGAGFKFWWRWESTCAGGHLVISIGGDQACLFPDTVSELQKLIKDHCWGLSDEH